MPWKWQSRLKYKESLDRNYQLVMIQLKLLMQPGEPPHE